MLIDIHFVTVSKITSDLQYILQIRKNLLAWDKSELFTLGTPLSGTIGLFKIGPSFKRIVKICYKSMSSGRRVSRELRMFMEATCENDTLKPNFTFNP